ncbi:diacylglycerol/lipid kinase family protein [Nonlabens sp.]|uniref:diacylglycerol/lipid kinase family protein n=1 Tax=Nonlabens sp. TaxID=1888209 RepID=UPI003F695D5C
MKKVAFLINPISGKNGNQLDISTVYQFLSREEYEVSSYVSKSKSDLQQLVKACIDKGYHYIIASGGDGTINTIASYLVNTSLILGIIPRGSGNGLAKHLGITDSLEELCSSLKAKKIKLIDVGEINGLYFFSNFALGFPAEVIKKYDQDPKRGFQTYLKHSIKTFINYKSNQYYLDNSEHPNTSVLISNTKYLGYNLSLTPEAQIDNGKLELITTNSKFDLIKKMLLAFLLKKSYSKSIKKAIINYNGKVTGQIDGEPCPLNEPIKISIHKRCLKVLIT